MFEPRNRRGNTNAYNNDAGQTYLHQYGLRLEFHIAMFPMAVGLDEVWQFALQVANGLGRVLFRVVRLRDELLRRRRLLRARLGRFGGALVLGLAAHVVGQQVRGRGGDGVVRGHHRHHVYVVGPVVAGRRHGRGGGHGVVPWQVQPAGGPEQLLDLWRNDGRVVLHGERQRVEVTVRAGRAGTARARRAVRRGGRVECARRRPDPAMELQVR